ncbi:MAG: hypothetical protein VX470_04760, partial [Planctomycetota bacterium]|nr:hypothetical protein [Planctomycetota bacterium]
MAACRPDSDTSSKNDGTSVDQAREDRLASAELDEDRQQEIWEAESVTFQMERRFGFRLKTAIMEGDQSFIRSAFGENSVIAITSASPVINNQAGIEEIKIQTVGPEDMTPISVEALATQFIDDFSAFEGVDGS